MSLIIHLLMLYAAGSAQDKQAFGVSSLPSQTCYIDPGRVLGITRPHCEALLGTVASGRIARLSVEQGRVVERGDLLVALDDELQQARVETARIQAESSVDIELAQAHLDYVERELHRLERLGEDTSDQEVQNARQEVDYAKLEVAKAKREHEKACQTLRLEQLRLRDLKIYAPFSGYVTELIRHEGETVNEQEAVVAVAQLDPLDVYLDCPLRLAKNLRAGETFRVEPANPQWPPRMGKVIMVSRVADPASQTLRVKITVDNKDGSWVSGLKVSVDLDKASCRSGPDIKAPTNGKNPSNDCRDPSSAERKREEEVAKKQ